MGTWSFGKSIKTQLTILLFVLTAVCIGVVGFVGVRGVINTGSKAENITSASAQDRAEQLLNQTTTATATKNGVIFNNIQLATDNVTTYAENILNNPAKFTANAWHFDDRGVNAALDVLVRNGLVKPVARMRPIAVLH